MGLPMANIAAVEIARREGMNDEEVFTRVLAGGPDLYEIVMHAYVLRPFHILRAFTQPSSLRGFVG